MMIQYKHSKYRHIFVFIPFWYLCRIFHTFHKKRKVPIIRKPLWFKKLYWRHNTMAVQCHYLSKFPALHLGVCAHRTALVVLCGARLFRWKLHPSSCEAWPLIPTSNRRDGDCQMSELDRMKSPRTATEQNKENSDIFVWENMYE